MLLKSPVRNRLVWCVAIVLIANANCVAADEQSDCAEIKSLVDRLSKNPTNLRGTLYSTDHSRQIYRSALQLQGSHLCTYELDEYDEYTIECIWLARTYESGKAIFNAINKSLHACSFVTKFNNDPVSADGRQGTRARIELPGDSLPIIINLENYPATMYSDRAVVREIIITFVRG